MTKNINIELTDEEFEELKKLRREWAWLGKGSLW